MTKSKLTRVCGHVDGIFEVHYESVGIQTEATLCNMQMFDDDPQDTTSVVDCPLCLSIVEMVQVARKERIPKEVATKCYCHVNGEPDKDCVWDDEYPGRPDDCIEAVHVKQREDCKWWHPLRGRVKND